jgi:hypothetical protein
VPRTACLITFTANRVHYVIWTSIIRSFYADKTVRIMFDSYFVNYILIDFWWRMVLRREQNTVSNVKIIM